MPQDYDLQDYSEPDQQDYGLPSYDLQDYKEEKPKPGFLEGLYRVPQEMYEGASKAGKSAYEHIQQGQYPEAFHDIVAPFTDPLEQALKGTVRLSQGKKPIEKLSQEQARKTGASQILGAVGLPGEEFQKAWEEGNYPYLAGQTVGALGTMYLGHRVNKAFTEPKPSGPAGGDAQGGTKFPEFDTKIPQEGYSSPHAKLPFEDFGPQVTPKEPSQGGLGFDQPDWMNAPELTPEQLAKKAKTATLDEPTPLKVAQMRQKGYVPLETTPDGKLKLIRKDLAPSESKAETPVQPQPQAPAPQETLPQTVSLKGASDVTKALLKSQGYVPNGVGPDGAPQWAIPPKGAVPPVVPKAAPKTGAAPGATPEGGIPITGDEITVPGADANTEIPGYKLDRVGPKGEGIFKKVTGNERGVINVQEIWDGLRRIFGRDPTEEEMRRDIIFTRRLQNSHEDRPTLEHDPGGSRYQFHQVGDESWLTYPDTFGENRTYGPFESPQDANGWIHAYEMGLNERDRSPANKLPIPDQGFQAESSQGIYDLQPHEDLQPTQEDIITSRRLAQQFLANQPQMTPEQQLHHEILHGEDLPSQELSAQERQTLHEIGAPEEEIPSDQGTPAERIARNYSIDRHEANTITDPRQIRDLRDYWTERLDRATASGNTGDRNHAFTMQSLLNGRIRRAGVNNIFTPEVRTKVSGLLADISWLEKNKLTPSGEQIGVPKTLDIGPQGEQGSLFPMEMRAQNQFQNIDEAGLKGLPQQELPFEPPVDRGPDTGPLPSDPEQADLGLTAPLQGQKKLPIYKRAKAATIDPALLKIIEASVDPNRASDALSHEYARTTLRGVPDGPPGLTVKDHDYGNMRFIEATYRDPQGKPVSHGTAHKEYANQPLKSGVLVSDKDAGFLYGKGLIEVLKFFAEKGVTAPSGLFSRHTADLLTSSLRRYLRDDSGFTSEGGPPVGEFEKPGLGGLGGETGALNFNEIVSGLGELRDKLAGKAQEFKEELPGRIGGLFKPGPQGQPSTFDEALNLSDAATTTADFSMPLRQGWSQVFTPEWRRALGPMFKGAFSAEKAAAIDAEIRAKPVFTDHFDPTTGKVIPSTAKRAGLKLIEGNKLSASENEAASNWIESGGSIPYASKAYRETLGQVAKVSNRAASTFLNHLRANTFERLMDSARDMSIEAGETGEARPGLFKQKFTPDQAMDLNPYHNEVLAKELADYVNTATGRGPLKTHLLPYTPELNIEGAAKLLKYGLFSPRNIASKVRMLNPSTYVMASPLVRKQYLKSMLGVTAAWGTVAGLAKGAGAITGVDTDVSLDPDSADFGKIRIGNVRLDPGGGFLQYLVAGHRLWQGGWTSSATNQYHRFGSGFRAETAGDMQERFVVNKLKPVTKFAYDLAHASEYQPFAVGDRVLQMYVPLVVQDVMELAQEDPKLVPWLTPLITGGMGSQIYSKGEAVSKFINPENDWNVTGGGIRDLMPWNWNE